MEKVIRDVSMLGLDKDKELLARELIGMMDMPVMFVVNSDTDRSVAGRSEMYRNLYGIFVQAQEEHSEYERIILEHLYRGVLEQQRTVHPCPAKEYIDKLNSIRGKEEKEARNRLYYDMIACIAAVASITEAEIYLADYGIETSNKAKERLFDDRVRILEDYLQQQKGIHKLEWYVELEIRNIIELSRIAFWNVRYKNKICSLLSKTYPAYKAKEYLSKLNKLVEMHKEAHVKFKISPVKECSKWVMEQIISIMGIENMVTFKRLLHMKGEYPSKEYGAVKMYSYVPGGVDNEQIVIDAIRIINTGILLVQEFYSTMNNTNLPNVQVNLIDAGYKQAYADGNSCDGYFISVTRGLLEFINSEIGKINLDDVGLSDIIGVLGEDEVLNRFYKYALYCIGVHEYAHVLNGDCDRKAINQDERMRMEEKADSVSYDMTVKVLFMQYRPKTDDIIKEGQIMVKNTVYDNRIFDVAYNWCRKIREKVCSC